MPTIIPVADIVELTLREDLGTLLGRWLRQVSLEEVRQGYEATLRAASPKRVRYWLLDLRRRGTIAVSRTVYPSLQALGMVAAVVKPVARILARNPADGFLQGLLQ
ncbi:hypothetical protein, partial [Hymenobacter elongatus]